MMAIFQRQMEYFGHDLEGWRDAFQGGAIDRGREELIDWYSMETEKMPLYFWTEKEFRVLPFEYIDNYDYAHDVGIALEAEPPGGLVARTATGAGYGWVRGNVVVDNSIGSAFRVRFAVESSLTGSGVQFGCNISDRSSSDRYGFSIISNVTNYDVGTIYAHCASAISGTTNTSIGLWEDGIWYDFKAYWFRGDSICHFYIDGTEKHTVQVALPETLEVFEVYIQNAGEPSTVHIRDFQIATD